MKFNISAKGILERDSEILFIEYSDITGTYYSLPGGSQEKGEKLSATVVREFKEETSLDIEAKEVLMVREFILESSPLPYWSDGIHQIEIIFICSLTYENQKPEIGLVPDPGMSGLKWIDKKDFNNYRIYPTQDLPDILEKRNVSYLFTNS